MIGVIAALDTEVELFRKSLEDIEKMEKGKHIFFTGKVDDREIVFAVSGVGKVNAAICTQLMIDHFNPTIIINTGIAGALSNDLNMMDTVIGTSLVYHDMTEGILDTYFPFTSEFICNKYLINLAKEAHSEGKLGKIATGDQFINSSKKKEELFKDHGALCVEMEGGAIAHTAFVNDKPFVVIRTISDLANDDAYSTYDEFEDKAAEVSSDIIIKMAKKLEHQLS